MLRPGHDMFAMLCLSLQASYRNIIFVSSFDYSAGAAANKLTLADLKMLFGLDLEQPANPARQFGPVRL